MLNVLILYVVAYVVIGNTLYPWRVVKVVDGDTLDVKWLFIKKRIRVLGVNTPERDELGYSQAKERLRSLCGKSVKIKTIGTDKYGRSVSLIYSPQGCVNVLQRNRYGCTKYDYLLTKKQQKQLEKEGWN